MRTSGMIWFLANLNAAEMKTNQDGAMPWNAQVCCDFWQAWVQSRCLEFLISEMKSTQYKSEIRWCCSSCTRAPIQLIQASAVFRKWRRASTARRSNSVTCIKLATTIQSLFSAGNSARVSLISALLFNTLVLLFGEQSNGYYVKNHLLSHVKC